MNRNEYRRAFIMLRPVRQGFGGHVRLERRTLTGSMYFIVTAPQGVESLTAALAGQQGGKYFAAAIGTLARDRRGQLTLAWQFDPRSIDGRPLEAYAWVTVAEAGSRCALALTGNVEGSRTLDARALERAVCTLFERESAADLPEAPAAPEAQALQEDVRIYTGSRARRARRAVREQPEAPETAPRAEATPRAEQAPRTEQALRAEAAPPGADSPAEAPRSDGPAEAQAMDAAPPQADGVMTQAVDPAEGGAQGEAEAPLSSGEEPAEAVTAAKRLGLDITAPWPGDAEPLRRLFATQPPVDAPLEGGYVYVRAPMPGGGRECLMGLKAEDGAITGMRYALPGRYAPEPPAALENYRWSGDGGEGFWTLDAAP